jgi:hypothetical protein
MCAIRDDEIGESDATSILIIDGRHIVVLHPTAMQMPAFNIETWVAPGHSDLK